jgi:hypothetical protein
LWHFPQELFKTTNTSSGTGLGDCSDVTTAFMLSKTRSDMKIVAAIALPDKRDIFFITDAIKYSYQM